jgi:hypothetical protein
MIRQYLDNRHFYGFLEFSETVEDIQTKFNTVWKYILPKYFVSAKSQKKILFVAPNGEFANRIRTMASAIYLANKLHMNIEHLWQGLPYKCAFPQIQDTHNKSFEYYFKQSVPRCDVSQWKTMITSVYTEWMPNPNPQSWYHFQNYGQQLLQPISQLDLSLAHEEMIVNDNFLLETTHMNHMNIRKKDMHAMYRRFFQPNDCFLKKLMPVQTTIGIALRTNPEFVMYFPESVIENLVLFKWLASFTGPVFLICDDLQKQTGMRKYLKCPIVPTYNESDMFLNFLQLSKCSKLYGTSKSAFAEEAAVFGNIEYIPLNKEFFQRSSVS